MSQQHFYFGVYLPTVGRKVYFKELTIGQLKGIVKTILNNDDAALSFCLYDVIKQNCKEDVDSLDLSIIDMFLVLLNMRVVSVGAEQKLIVTCEETQKTFSVNVNYNQIVDQIEKIQFVTPDPLTKNGVTVEFGLPLAVQNFSTENLEFNRISSSIRGIKIGPLEHKISTLDLYNVTRIIDYLPRSLFEDILKYLEQEEKKINTVKFINAENPFTNKKIEQSLSLDHHEVIRILKIALKEDLMTLYKSIHYMIRILHYSGDYVENMTVNEQQLHWSFYLADEAEKKKAASNNKTPGPSLPVRDATQDFLNEIP